MRFSAVLLLLTLAAPTPEIRYFHYERPLQNLPQTSGQACLALDAGIFAHAAPELADLRLYRDTTETAYVIQTSAPTAAAEQIIKPVNLGKRGGQTVFDADMPAGKYSDLQLDITGHDFIATVTVTGKQAQNGSAGTRIGSYTIFDLTKQKLGRSTVLHLPESDFRILHFSIAGPIAPDRVNGLSVTRLAATHPKYATVAESSSVAQKGHSSVIEFTVPANTPVDRVAFAPGPAPTNFSRNVGVSAVPNAPPKTVDADGPASPIMNFSGNLLRVHRTQDGHRIDEEHLSVNAPQEDFNQPAKWTVTIENGDDAPLQIDSVRLQMLERRLCFDAAAGANYALYYGDAALEAPRYDYATLFTPQANTVQVQAGPEQPNPTFQPRPDDRPFTEKHPALLWVALGLAVVLLGFIALRSAKAV
jgi:Protein of unknown function (DUF3999)